MSQADTETPLRPWSACRFAFDLFSVLYSGWTLLDVVNIIQKSSKLLLGISGQTQVSDSAPEDKCVMDIEAI